MVENGVGREVKGTSVKQFRIAEIRRATGESGSNGVRRDK